MSLFGGMRDSGRWTHISWTLPTWVFLLEKWLFDPPLEPSSPSCLGRAMCSFYVLCLFPFLLLVFAWCPLSTKPPRPPPRKLCPPHSTLHSLPCFIFLQGYHHPKCKVLYFYCLFLLTDFVYDLMYVSEDIQSTAILP